MSVRKRRSPQESRKAAIEAARSLLLEEGPEAVTLKAVAARVGQTHANILHHFGSAASLQAALGAHISDMVCGMILRSTQARLAGVGSVRESIDLVFDAYAHEGGSALFAWLALHGDKDGLKPMAEAIAKVSGAVSEDGKGSIARRQAALVANLLAFADALVGESMAKELDLPRTRVRDIAQSLFESVIADDIDKLRPKELQ
jgi:AcrR family transcriptional regulator